MKISAVTDIGMKRQSNQDAFVYGELPAGGFYAVVCDGMGGHAGGNVASKLATERIAGELSRNFRENMSASSVRNMIESAVVIANLDVFDAANTPIVTVYNDYFGSGMNSIVFQEMREARGLAYTATARYTNPAKMNDTYSFTTFIATQNDKMIDAVKAFDEIVNNMPQSEGAFNIAKENIIANLRTNRVLGEDVIGYYLMLKKRGLEEDEDKLLFEKVQNFTLKDVVDFQQQVIKDRKYVIGILGTEKDLDIATLQKMGYGNVERVSLEDIFGY